MAIGGIFDLSEREKREFLDSVMNMPPEQRRLISELVMQGKGKFVRDHENDRVVYQPERSDRYEMTYDWEKINTGFVVTHVDMSRCDTLYRYIVQQDLGALCAMMKGHRLVITGIEAMEMPELGYVLDHWCETAFNFTGPGRYWRKWAQADYYELMGVEL